MATMQNMTIDTQEMMKIKLLFLILRLAKI